MKIDSNQSQQLFGTPSDELPDVLATGRTGITTLFVSMAKQHPDGADADYLRWHTLDHRPEQQRLASIEQSLRIVSTPECRAARAVSDERFDAIDHVMTYFFTSVSGLDEFNELSIALHNAGRTPFVLPPVQRGVYTLKERTSAPRVKVGADVMPWLPTKGIYLLIERGSVFPSPDHLINVPGVAGVWSAHSVPADFSNADTDQQITYCFLDDDPIDTAERLQPSLKQRWDNPNLQPLFAAPFYTVVPYDWNRFLP